VQNFSALPETIGTPAVDSAYLVREAEGTWLLARKPAGIYIRTADTGVRAADWTHAGAFPDVFNDANFLLYDNSDSTKNLAFQLSGLTTGTVRTLTAPDASGTIALTSDFASPPAIGSTTPNSAAFTTLTANNGTLTASAPVLDLAQTWNNAGVAFTGASINMTNTARTPQTPSPNAAPPTPKHSASTQPTAAQAAQTLSVYSSRARQAEHSRSARRRAARAARGLWSFRRMG
jgi:hypothetical protein